jgi:tripartite ATP-independent transporter DctM subunit
MTIWVFLLSIIGAMAIGMPIAFALLFCGVALLITMGMLDPRILAQQLISGSDSFPLMAIPFFLLVGQIMNAAGISKRIVDFALALVGHIRGGLGYVAVIAAFIFAGLSGSAVADAAALSAILIPMMAKNGYDKGSSGALIASSGIIALIIPPSMSFIIFGAISGVSVMKLFMAGIVPAVVLSLGLCITWYFVSKKMDMKVLPRKSFKEILRAGREAIWALLLPIIIILGIRIGLTTPTEAAVVAVVYTIFLNFAIYREVKFKQFIKLFTEGAKTSSIIMFLISAAMISAWTMAMANIPTLITQLLNPFLDNKILLLLAINVLVFLVGTAMDSTPTVLILTPVLMPIIVAAGIDPVFFGVIFILNNSIGLLTPPVGTVLNAACGGGNISMDEMLVKVIPFLAVEVVVLLLLTIFPELTIIPYQFLTGR